MALSSPVYGAVAYSGAGGTTVAPAYPTNTTGDQLILIIGMKPSTANSGSVTTPSGWTLVTSIVGAGGYGATLGVDTGNTNLFVYTRTAPSGGLSGTLTVTVATNNICWGIIGEITSTTGNAITVTGWTSSDTTAGNVSASFTTGTSLKPNVQLHMAMCIPTDVTTPAQFSGYALTSTGVTFGTITELAEPDSTTGNDIGGFLAWGTVSSGTSSGNTTLTATAGGTTTNVRGALVLVEFEEVPLARTITIDVGSYTMTGTGANFAYYRYTDEYNGIYLEALGTSFVNYGGTGGNRQILNVRTSAVAQLNFSGEYWFQPTGVGGTLNNGGYPIEGKWQYRTVGGSWTDVGAVISNTQQAIVILNTLDTDGAINFAQTLTTGLSANTNYDVQLLVRRTASTPATDEMWINPENIGGINQYATVSAVLATGYTITIDSGSYTLTGTAVGLVRGRRIVNDSGSYSLNGTAVNLVRGRRIVIDSGSYSVTGTNANLLFARSIIIGAGSYALNGTAVGLVAGRVIVANAGSYSYTGTDVTLTLTISRTITIDSGSYTLTGSAVGLLFGKRIAIDSGSYALTGTAVGLTSARRIIIDSASYALSGTAVNLAFGKRISVDSGSYSVTGSAVGFVSSRRIAIDSGSYTLSGSAVGFAYVRRIIIDSGSYALSGSAVGLTSSRRIAIDSGSYALSGSAVGLQYARRIIIDSASYSVTGSAVGLISGKRITIDSGSYTYTGTSVDLSKLCPKQNSDSTLGTASTTTLVAISDVMCVSTNSNGLLSFSGDLTYAPQTMTDGVYSAYLLWRYRTIGGSFIDVGTETLATVFAEVISGSLAITGEINASATLTGLSANTNYEVQLYARRGSPPSNTLEFSGTASVEAVAKIFINAGTYTYTGTNVGLLYARRIIVDSGSYTLSGTAVNLASGKRISIDSGSYSLTGSAVGTLYGRRVIVDVGSYTYSGSAVGLAVGRKIVIDSGSYALSGSAVNVMYGRRVLVEGGAYTVTGSAVGLVASRKLIVDSGSYALTGTDVALSVTSNKIITIDAGSYSLSGSAVGTIYSRRLVIDAGSYAYNGSSVGLVRGRRVIIDSGAYTLSGSVVSLARGRRIVIDSGSYSYTGTAVGVFRNRTIGINSGVYNLTGTAVTITYITGISNLYLGADPVVNLKLGTSSVSKVYKGSTQVYG